MWIEGENDNEGGDETQGEEQSQASTPADQGPDQGNQGTDDGGDGARQPEPSKAEKALAAFDEGVAEATPKGADAVRDPVGATGSDGATGATGTDPAVSAGATGATGATGTTGTTGAAKPTEDQTTVDKKARVEAEIAELNLKTDKVKKRFRELSERPTWEEVTEQFKPVAELAQEARQYQAILAETKANPQQVGEMFLLLGHINSGDPARIKTAVDSMYKELTWAATKIGVRLDAFDPIDQFPDIKTKLDAEEITPEVAQELMAARRAQGMTAEQRAAQQRSQEQQAAHKKKLDTAVEEIRVFDTQVRTDPQYEAKKAIVAHTIERLKRTRVDPSLWPGEIRQAWNEARVAAPVATPAPAPARAASPSPIRPSTSAGAPQRPGVPKDPYDAFDMGVQEANRGMSIYD